MKKHLGFIISCLGGIGAGFCMIIESLPIWVLFISSFCVLFGVILDDYLTRNKN